jgi:hypothetical protein
MLGEPRKLRGGPEREPTADARVTNAFPDRATIRPTDGYGPPIRTLSITSFFVIARHSS